MKIDINRDKSDIKWYDNLRAIEIDCDLFCGLKIYIHISLKSLFTGCMIHFWGLIHLLFVPEAIFSRLFSFRAQRG